ncbi:MAG: D-alanyl-D-alanine carboxypeptidase/D-alanyl-D-alanine-endopeptidase [Bdellovibrionaceae bacterium]|nr:D-alanyl-D-alanine carboxypeptidase/D-alanyl-D-alanine-endopeptidase [Pseudobdellovibrionaceae bacterium]
MKKMKKKSTHTPLLLFLTILLCTTAPLPLYSATIETEIKALLGVHGKKISFSLRGPDGHEIFNINGDKSLAPASIAKVVSTGCSLNILGPQFQFETFFGYKGKIEGETLKGDLVIQGGGDPSLVIEDLREVIEKLRYVHGIKKIEGSLIFDVSYFGVKSIKMAEGFDGDNGRSFAADLTAISMNQNSFSFWVTADHRNNQKTRAVTLPAQVLDIEVTNKTKIGSSTAVSVSYSPENQKAVLSGTISSDAEPKGLYRSVDDPYVYYTKLIRRLWTDSGGEWSSKEKYSIEIQPVKMTLLWKNYSRPLAKILMDINKLSLNLGAEMTLLAAGASKRNYPANYEKSLSVIKSCLKDFGVVENDIVLTNASGLSREAEIKTTALTQFLYQMQKSSYSAEYLTSFSLLGIDGTTKSRLQEYAGRGRVKTGSIRGVRSITGILTSKKREPYTFALILNGVDASDPDVKKSEDRVLEKILQTY